MLSSDRRAACMGIVDAVLAKNNIKMFTLHMHGQGNMRVCCYVKKCVCQASNANLFALTDMQTDRQTRTHIGIPFPPSWSHLWYIFHLYDSSVRGSEEGLATTPVYKTLENQ